jgi:predicted RNA-binding Zn ribbon-like protein
MTVERFDAGPQPAGRPPAPGRLGLVQAFLNSFWVLGDHGAEGWPDAPAYGRWLAGRGFGGRAPAEADRATAIELREALRALALANHDDATAPEAEATLDRIAAAAGVHAALVPRFGDGPDRLDVAGDGPEAALALVLGVVFAARASGEWRRMKACPHERCGWTFYDRSRNRSSQWCSMRICGNRTKGEALRRRRRGASVA